MNGIETQSTDIDVASESIGQRIVMAVANRIDADPMELEPLYETIDPEALGQVFHADMGAEIGQQSRIVFTYAGCEVTVYGNDEIEVAQLADQRVDQTDLVVGGSKPTAQSD